MPPLPFMKKADKEPKSRTMEQAVGLGYQLLAATLLFVGLGYYADQRRGGGGVLFTLIGIGLTFLYGSYEVWKLVKLIEREAEREAEARRRGHSQP